MSHGFRERSELLRLFGVPNPSAEMLLDIRDGSIPSFLSDRVFAVVGNTPTVFRPPADALAIGILIELESFAIRTGDQLARTVDAVVTTGLTGLTVSGHGYSNGDGPILLTSDDTLPGNTASGTMYFMQASGVDSLHLHLSREAAESGATPVVISSGGVGTHTLGGFAAPAAVTDTTVGDNTITLNAGDGRGNSPIVTVFQAFRARPLTVSGQTANSRLKCVTL